DTKIFQCIHNNTYNKCRPCYQEVTCRARALHGYAYSEIQYIHGTGRRQAQYHLVADIVLPDYGQYHRHYIQTAEHISALVQFWYLLFRCQEVFGKLYGHNAYQRAADVNIEIGNVRMPR